MQQHPLSKKEIVCFSLLRQVQQILTQGCQNMCLADKLSQARWQLIHCRLIMLELLQCRGSMMDPTR